MTEPTDKPRKTLTITRKSTAPANPDTATTTHTRSSKRVITRDQLPAVQKPGTPKKPATKPAKTTNRRKPRQPPKPKKTPPSELRARELSDSLNAFEVWRTRKPLALGVEKQLFRHIADLQLSASKRVVQKLLHHHTHNRAYLLNVGSGGVRFNLDGSMSGAILPAEQLHAARLFAAMPKT